MTTEFRHLRFDVRDGIARPEISAGPWMMTTNRVLSAALAAERPPTFSGS